MIIDTVFCENCYIYHVARFCHQCGLERKVRSLSRPIRCIGESPDVITVAGMRVFSADSTPQLHAHNLQDGKHRWSIPIASRARRIVCTDDGRLYVALRQTNQLIAVDSETGKRRWTFRELEGNCGEPLLHGGRLWFGDAGGSVFSLRDVGTRYELDQRQNSVRKPISHAPIWWKGRLIVGTWERNSRVLMLDKQLNVSRALAQLRREHLASMMLLGNDLLVAGRRGTLMRLQLPFDEPRWTYRMQDVSAAHANLIGRITIHNNHLFAVMSDNTLHTVDLQTGRAARPPMPLPDGCTGVTAWEGLLLVASEHGLSRYDAATGDPIAWPSTPTDRCWTAPQVDAYGNIVVGLEKGGVLALPWHWENDFRWASDWRQQRDDLEGAATYASLAQDEATAKRAPHLWITAGYPERAAVLYQRRGEHLLSAENYARAARNRINTDPQQAVMFYERAAEQYDDVGDRVNSADMRRLAVQLSGGALLKVATFNVPDIEAGYAGTITFEIRNHGKVSADHIILRLGGNLHQSVWITIEQPLPVRKPFFVNIDNVIPTRYGQQDVTLSVSYTDAGRRAQNNAPLELKQTFPLMVSEPPDFDFGEDVGSVIIRVPRGERIPRVRVRGSTGMVKFERIEQY